MSNIRIDNIAPSAGGTYRNAPRGIGAAWVNFNGTGTPAIRDSENVGSITDNGTGNYTVNFTNNMGNANYVTASMACREAIHVPYRNHGAGYSDTSYLTGSFKLLTGEQNESSHGYADFPVSTLIIHGDLA